jgi:hypothetical protein
LLRVDEVLRLKADGEATLRSRDSVLRMHQSRHRTLNQRLLDLKCLYWNTRAFRGGKRKGRCPYEHLGLPLAGSDFWGLLHAEMSPAGAKAEARAQEIAA